MNHHRTHVIFFRYTRINLKHFPADVQELTITISTPTHSSEVKLVHCKDKTSSVNIKYFIDSHEWHLYKHISVREYSREDVFLTHADSKEEAYAAIDLSIHAARRPSFYYWNAFFLIFLITTSQYLFLCFEVALLFFVENKLYFTKCLEFTKFFCNFCRKYEIQFRELDEAWFSWVNSQNRNWNGHI